MILDCGNVRTFGSDVSSIRRVQRHRVAIPDRARRAPAFAAFTLGIHDRTGMKTSRLQLRSGRCCAPRGTVPLTFHQGFDVSFRAQGPSQPRFAFLLAACCGGVDPVRPRLVLWSWIHAACSRSCPRGRGHGVRGRSVSRSVRTHHRMPASEPSPLGRHYFAALSSTAPRKRRGIRQRVRSFGRGAGL